MRASRYRRSPEYAAELQAWLDSDEHAQLAQAEQIAAAYEAAMYPADEEVRERFAAAAATGETCATCGRALGSVLFRAPAPTGWSVDPEHGLMGDGKQYRSAPVCPDCLCPSHTVRMYCERCRPTGSSWRWVPSVGTYLDREWTCPDLQPGERFSSSPNHSQRYCDKCHPSSWMEAHCPGCERTVMVRPSSRTFRVLDEETGGLLPPRVYCSQRCRTKVDSGRAKSRRIEDRLEDSPHLCGGCGEVLDGKRSDAKFCSPACRQRAYRTRTAEAAS